MIIKRKLRFDSSASYAIDVDVGGTKINAGFVDARGEIVCLRSLPTLAEQWSVGDRIETAISNRLVDPHGSYPDNVRRKCI